MAMGGGGGEEEPIVGINVTPLVDVCLVLVIIFMVTAPLMSEPLFQVDLPQARTNEGKEEEKIIVTLAVDRFAVRDAEFESLEKMWQGLDKVLRRSRNKIVIIKADKRVLHGVLVETMQRAKEFGARSLTIATERRKAAP